MVPELPPGDGYCSYRALIRLSVKETVCASAYRGNSASAIVPILLGSEALAFHFATRCNLEGLYALPVVYPAVPKGAERLRMNVTCDHRRRDLNFAIEVLQRARAEEVSCAAQNGPTRRTTDHQWGEGR